MDRKMEKSLWKKQYVRKFIRKKGQKYLQDQHNKWQETNINTNHCDISNHKGEREDIKGFQKKRKKQST